MATAAIRRFETGISSSAHREEPTLNVAIGASQAMGSRRRQNAHTTCHQVQVIFAERGAEQAAPEKLFLFFSLNFHVPSSFCEGKNKILAHCVQSRTEKSF